MPSDEAARTLPTIPFKLPLLKVQVYHLQQPSLPPRAGVSSLQGQIRLKAWDNKAGHPDDLEMISNLSQIFHFQELQ